jgi:hypothetical protein
LVALPGDANPETDVERALDPYHEFECTGVDDQWVQEVDLLPGARALFPDAVIYVVVRPDGTRTPLVGDNGQYAAEFSSATGKLQLPEGCEIQKAPAPEYTTFAAWACGFYGVERVLPGAAPDLAGAHKYGYMQVDAAGTVVKLIRRTNPNARWDWWVIGGRWNDYLYVEPPGSRANIARKHAVNVAARDAALAAAAGDHYDEVRSAVGDLMAEYQTLEQVCANYPDDFAAARSAYRAQAAVQAAQGALLGLEPLERFSVSREEYVAARVLESSAPFAFVDLLGGWHERGWGAVSDEQDGWPERFAELYAALPEDTWLVTVDCHI